MASSESDLDPNCLQNYQQITVAGKDLTMLDRNQPVTTVQPRYLKVKGNGKNTSSYLKFDISKCDVNPI